MPWASRAARFRVRGWRWRSSRLTVRQALALGALHGPTELLPISSSGHVAALPWLLGWRYSELGDETRKSFEVALHAGSAAAWLLPTARKGGSRGPPGRRDLLLLGLGTAPAGVTGLLFERPIERRLGTPGLIAAGLAAGAAVMAAADRAPKRRDADQAGPADAAWLGLAQATALLPGISRTGASLATARPFLAATSLHQPGDAGVVTLQYPEEAQRRVEIVQDLFDTLGIDQDETSYLLAPPLPAWRLMRLDDNANTVEMSTFTGYAKARAALAQYQSRLHKQSYWLEEA